MSLSAGGDDPIVATIDERRPSQASKVDASVKDADVITFTQRVTGISDKIGFDMSWRGWKVSRVICHRLITKIGREAFEQCHTLKHLVVEGACRIESKAFAVCDNLEEAVLTHVTEIGPAAFMGCAQLKKVSFDHPGMTLGSGAFAGCTSLTTVPSLAGVNDYTFSMCSSLTTVTLRGAFDVRHRAFYKCTALEVVILDISGGGPPTRIAYTAFEGCNDGMEIQFVDRTEIAAGNPNPCLKICSYNVAMRSWSSMYASSQAIMGPRDFSCIARFRRTISLVVDMGGGNSCTVTSTLAPEELPSSDVCVLAIWNRTKLSIQRPAPPLLFSGLNGDDYEIYGWEIPGVSYKALLRTEYPERFPDDNFHVAYLGHKVEPALNPRELAMGIVSGADWMTGWQKNEHDGYESDYAAPWLIVYHDPDDAPEATEAPTAPIEAPTAPTAAPTAPTAAPTAPGGGGGRRWRGRGHLGRAPMMKKIKESASSFTDLAA